MRQALFAIWALGLIAMTLVNASGAWTRMYKGVQGRVDGSVVSVFEPTGKQGEVTVPVMAWDESSGDRVETGEHVQVYLRYAYKDDEIVWYPRVTLALLAGVMFVTAIAWGSCKIATGRLRP